MNREASGSKRAERRAAPKPARIPSGEWRRICAFRQFGKRLPERRPACKPAARPTYSSDEGRQ